MRKEYRRAVREAFAARVIELCPGFNPVKVSSPLLHSGESIFRWMPCDRLKTFVILVPSPTGHQAFTLEIGWSTAGRFPELSVRPSLVLAAEDPLPIHVEEGIVRIGDLNDRRDMWWHLPDPAMDSPGDLEALKSSLEPVSVEEAAETVRPKVDEALDVLVGVGIPFLRVVARRYCSAE